MKINIYQIDLERDKDSIAFESYALLEDFQGSPNVNSEIYNRTFTGEVDCDSIEGVYTKFNSNLPADYYGRSMSVSDVVEIVESDTEKIGFYYCDVIGFEKIDFDKTKCKDLDDTEKIRVVVCEPGKKAYETKIGTSLTELQNEVSGFIEAYYPFNDEVCIICNEDGKMNGMSPCRAIYDDGNGELFDIVFGKFIICDCSSDRFASLSDEMAEKYLNKFELAENFYYKNKQIEVQKYNPEEDKGMVR